MACRDRNIESRKGLLLLGVLCLSLSSCGSMDRDFKLQNWEKCRIAAEQALKKHRKSSALSMALETVAVAEAFGDSDFRLGISLCILGDAQRANKQNNESEASYKRSIMVLSRAAKIAAEQKSGIVPPEVMQKLVSEDLSRSLSHLGDLYAEEERYADAAQCYESAAGRYQSLVDSCITESKTRDFILEQQLAQSLLGLARVSAESKNLDLADLSYQRALRIAAGASGGECQLRDIRDEYLKVLQKTSRQKQAEPLIADMLWSQHSADGSLALYEGDFTAAEIAYRKALTDAANSIFSERRILRSLFDLITLFSREGKPAEVVQCSRLADNFVQAHPHGAERDYDQIQDILANYYFVSGNFPLAEIALERQFPYKVRKFGVESPELCTTYAMLGQTAYKMNNRPLALRYAMKAYGITKIKRLDKTFYVAINKTAELTLALDRFAETEELEKRLIAIKAARLGEANALVVSLKANLLVLYQRFQKRAEAGQSIKETIAALDKAASEQRASAFPYVVVSLTICLVSGWFDLAESLAQLGQSILQKDLSGAFPGDMVKEGWTKDIEILEKNTGKSFH